MSLLNDNQSSEARRYQGSKEDLSYRELRLGKWYVRNKTKVANLGIGVLLIFAITTVGYSLVMWIGYAAIGFQQDARNAAVSVSQFQDYTLLKPTFNPEALAIGRTITISQGNDRRDLITEVRNPNSNWIATVRFGYSDGTTEPRIFTQQILPTARTLLADLGAPGTGTRASLQVYDISWERIDNKRISNPPSFMAPRLNFTLEDLDIRRYDASLETPASVAFTVYNDTAYGYWDGDFYVVLYSGESIVAVRPLRIDRFEAGSRESVQFNFGSDRLNVSDVELLPNIDVFDGTSYLPVE